MATDANVDEYLTRIGIEQSMVVTNENNLIRLHVHHLTHIPFETFDLIDIKQLTITLDHIFQRLVRDKRGGVCYQMNGLFQSILVQLGYHVRAIACAVYNEKQDFYMNPYSHMSLYVKLSNDNEYLCDVGFSRDFLTPLYFRTDCIQYATNGFFRLCRTNDGKYYQLERGFLNVNDEYMLPVSDTLRTHVVDIASERLRWFVSYRFSIDFMETSIELGDFQGTCSYITHSPEVILNRQTICHRHTLMPHVGAYGIVGKSFWLWYIEHGIEHRQKIPICHDNDRLKMLLKEKFDLVIERSIELVDQDE
jgi:arylamine N-acetyltransferase